jgi:hypothetical protein
VTEAATAGGQKPIEGQGTGSVGYVGRIPVRTLWLLMLYASDLFRAHGTRDLAVEENPDNLPQLKQLPAPRAEEKGKAEDEDSNA